MKLSPEEVRHIALLARLNLSDDEVELMRTHLSNILENFEILKQVDTSSVPPTTHSVALRNVFRNDRVVPSLPVEEVLANAPQREESSFKVKAVLEEQ